MFRRRDRKSFATIARSLKWSQPLGRKIRPLMSTSAEAASQESAQLQDAVRRVRAEISKVIIGQDQVVKEVMIAILTRSHALLVGVPGLAKTLLISSLAEALRLSFKRIQFTPDLMPSDITGTEVIYSDPATNEREFKFLRGPIFANIILADEINRTPPKTQAAMLESMQERKVTVGGEDHPLPEPFFVLATQNPIEQEGTYPLPEAQLDRFLFKLEVTRNDVATLERIVNNRELGTEPEVQAIMDETTLEEVLSLVRRIFLPEVVGNYIARLVDATHPGQSNAARNIKYGSSPRAALSLAASARAHALMNERTHASFEDVKFVAPSVLRHRVILEYNARVEGLTANEVIASLLEEIPFQAGATPRTLHQTSST